MTFLTTLTLFLLIFSLQYSSPEVRFPISTVLYIPTEKLATTRLRVVEPCRNYVATAVGDSVWYDRG